MQKKIFSSDISKFLNLDLYGDNFEVKSPRPLDEPFKNSIVFMKNYDENIDGTLENIGDVLVITNNKMRTYPNFIISKNPKLDFVRAVVYFFEKKRFHRIHPTAVVEKGSLIGNNVNIGAYSYIGSDVSIGEGTFIANNVTVTGKTIIGGDCKIKSGAVIGSEGFNFPYDENGRPIHFHHFGSVEIGDRVWIGANSAVDCGTLSVTTIKNDVKIDNLVHISHNCCIGENSLVPSGAIFCGGVRLGKDCWVAPNSSIKGKITVEDGSMIGLGSVVIKDISKNTTVFGNPAKVIRTKKLDVNT